MWQFFSERQWSGVARTGQPGKRHGQQSRERTAQDFLRRQGDAAALFARRYPKRAIPANRRPHSRDAAGRDQLTSFGQYRALLQECSAALGIAPLCVEQHKKRASHPPPQKNGPVPHASGFRRRCVLAGGIDSSAMGQEILQSAFMDNGIYIFYSIIVE